MGNCVSIRRRKTSIRPALDNCIDDAPKTPIHVKKASSRACTPKAKVQKSFVDQWDSESWKEFDERRYESLRVKNGVNSKERWEQTIADYDNLIKKTKKESGYKINVKVVIDNSGSMEGKKLIAVKLGLCALISHLAPTDHISISKFSTTVNELTNGFVEINYLKKMLPCLLEVIEAENDTCVYDAVYNGLQSLQSAYTSSSDNQRNILVALTDGEDNKSYNTIDDVTDVLGSPKINNFMFILMAVGMTSNTRRIYKDWMKPRHCKQLHIDVITGTRLVETFKEVLMNRILTDDDDKFATVDEKGDCVVRERKRCDSPAASVFRSEYGGGDSFGSPAFSRSNSFNSDDEECVQGIPLWKDLMPNDNVSE